MEFFNPGTNIDFLGIRKWAAAFSIIVFIISVVGLIVHGLDFGLDFTGGTQIQLQFKHTLDLNKIRGELDQAGFKETQVQSYGDSHNILVTIASNKKSGMKQIKDEKARQEKLTKAILQALPGAKANSIDYIGTG